MATLDIDEFIIPVKHKSLRKMIQYLESNFKEHSSFMMKQYFFPMWASKLRTR